MHVGNRCWIREWELWNELMCGLSEPTHVTYVTQGIWSLRDQKGVLISYIYTIRSWRGQWLICWHAVLKNIRAAGVSCIYRGKLSCLISPPKLKLFTWLIQLWKGLFLLYSASYIDQYPDILPPRQITLIRPSYYSPHMRSIVAWGIDFQTSLHSLINVASSKWSCALTFFFM